MTRITHFFTALIKYSSFRTGVVVYHTYLIFVNLSKNQSTMILIRNSNDNSYFTFASMLIKLILENVDICHLKRNCLLIIKHQLSNRRC